MASEKILIIEDDQHISKLIRYNLEKEGFECRTADRAEHAFEILKECSIALILLDIMLPGTDGFAICKRIRQQEPLNQIPIIILTARSEEVDRIVGFELGADDYMVKPFSPRELVLRVKAVLKRVQSTETKMTGKEILSFGKLKVDMSRHKVMVANKEVILTTMEFKLLVLLMKRRGRLQSRETLLNDVWDISADVTTRTVDTHIKRLRQKLGSAESLIETIRGFGYRFIEEEED